MLLRRLVTIVPLIAAAAVAHGAGPGPVAGRIAGDYLYPEFQRWQIIGVTRATPAKIPADAGGIPAILINRPVYFNASYFTMPFLNSSADVLHPACFRIISNGLEARLVTGRSYDDKEPFTFISSGDRLTLVYGAMFVLTLQRRAAADDAVRKRALDDHFNTLLQSGVPQVVSRGLCELPATGNTAASTTRPTTPPATPSTPSSAPAQPPPDARSIVAAAFRQAEPVQNAVFDYYATAKRWPTGTDVLRNAGPLRGLGIERITVNNGTVVIAFSALLPELAGKQLALRPTMGTTANMFWTCGNATANPRSFEPPSGPAARVASTVDSAYLPAQCQ